MAERPILFSAPMIRALLAGTKTQTRRVLKTQPVGTPHYGQASLTRSMTKPVFYAAWDERAADGSTMCKCPFGVPGDRLWVRESHWFFQDEHDPVTGYSPPILTLDDVEYRADGEGARNGWRPSIHMPRWASRLTLNITDVRVERLQDISEADALAEGCVASPFPGPWWQGYRRMDDGELLHQQAVGEAPPDWMVEPHRMREMTHLGLSAVDAFRSLWFSINGAESWEANPWVWAISFAKAAQQDTPPAPTQTGEQQP